MAIAGLHNVPLLETSLLRESQSSSLGRRSNQGRMSTRASSILQMWRELEDECAVSRARERVRPRLNQVSNEGLSVCREGEGSRSGLEDLSESENGSVINSESHIASLNEQDDRQSMTSEASQDLGEVERERVRKIFREWMSSGGNVESPRAAHVNRSPRAQCPGENDHERVRIVRNWIQMNSQQREACSGNRGNQVAETGSQIENIREGLVLDHNEGQPENSRRQICKLRGRQALLDLLAKKEEERRQELLCLEGTRPVSGFAHRNRIQSLLRLRCFQNMRSIELSRPSSARESELGLLRRRQTVSGLREGFLSRLDSNIHVQVSDLSNSPSDNDEDVLREAEPNTNNVNEDLDGAHEQNDPTNAVINGNHEQNDCAIVVHDGAHEQNDPKGDVDVGPSTSLSGIESNVCPSVDLNQHMECLTRDTNLRQRDSQVEPIRCHGMENAVADGPVTVSSGHSIGSSEDGSPRINFEELLRRQSGELGVVDEAPENFHEHATGIEEIVSHSGLDDQFPTSQSINGHESSLVVDDWPEQVSEYQRDWEGSAISDQWRDFPVETNGTHLTGDAVDVSHGALESEGGEQNDAQEDYWHDNGSQETPRDWLGMPSGSRLASDRLDTYYYSDDDNVYHIELRELVNRRRVSSLLHSDFRDSLDQLIQSYVERQTNAPDDWELQEMLPPFLPRNQEPSDVDQDEAGSVDILTGGREESLPTPPPPPPQRHWGQGLHRTNWARNEIRQRPGTEWEIINDLRIDMARLAQRLNNMQRMLEACMDMQLELQRSVRQEVSAALNRSVNPSELPENVLPEDSFKWDSVRKGVCCICTNTNIDSLLYRCGHMCTCTKCADVLVQGNGKCPMCQAPIIEVIRAYFIQ